MLSRIDFEVVKPKKHVVDVRSLGRSAIEVQLPGKQGVPGNVGLSAYELAVEQGFEGTLDEWLASLTGPRGETGDSGVYIGTEIPSDSGVSVWIDPSGAPDVPDGDTEAY